MTLDIQLQTFEATFMYLPSVIVEFFYDLPIWVDSQ